MPGSPVGRWAGYLLLQHKDQLGGSRYIEKVRLFKPPRASLPYLLFYVAKEPFVGETGPLAAEVVDARNASRLVRRSGDGKNIVREHVVYLQS
jgi:hypothetical protein